MKNKLILILTLCVVQSCVGVDWGVCEITLNNESGYPVASFVADGFNSGFSYPDTDLQFPLNDFCLTEHITGLTRIYASRSGSYERMLSSTKQGVLSVYIFDQRAIDQEGWKALITKGAYLVRYDLTADDLEDLDGKISFPLSPEMKDLKVYYPNANEEKRY